MNENKIFKLLEHPVVYQTAQTILAPGGEIYLRKRIKQLTTQFTTKHNLLDVGCGPASWLRHEGISPVGLDFSFSYAKAFSAHGGRMAVGSAEKLPFSTDSFAGVWSIGLLHHMNDAVVIQAIKEMIRVCHPNGYIVIMDAVLPENPWTRPLASIIRHMDRGRHMRSQLQLKALCPDQNNWSTKRYTYAVTGLEMLEFRYKKTV